MAPVEDEAVLEDVVVHCDIELYFWQTLEVEFYHRDR